MKHSRKIGGGGQFWFNILYIEDNEVYFCQQSEFGDSADSSNVDISNTKKYEFTFMYSSGKMS